MIERRWTGWRRWALGSAACGLLLTAGAVLAQNADYERGRAALDKRDWKEAVRAFVDASRDGRDDADAAIYWQAYALSKLGQTARALSAIDRLGQRYPDSRWIDDGEVLRGELEGSGDPLSTTAEEVKLAVLMSLTHSAPARALPYLKKFLAGAHSTEGKESALFMLMQTGTPEAMEIVADLVRDGDDSELRVAAIHSLGMADEAAGQKLLGEVYDQTRDREVKEAVLQAYMMSGRQAEILSAARNDADPELREQAVQLLGAMGGTDELWTMYGSESDLEVKEAILQGLAIGGGGRYLQEVAKGSGPVELRAAALQGLAIGTKTSPDYFVQIYDSSDEEQIVEAALNAMMMSGQVKAMIALARKEKDPAKKRRIVERLAMTGSEEATAYMLELLDE